ncbi:MAG: polyphosphate kinase 1 [Flavobacteriales bacterium]|nr:polyphosphate kinase 1 [Flavobacteriales bacterium]
MTSTALIEQARLFVRRHFARDIPKWMAFHDLDHTLEVARFSQSIGRGSGLSEQAVRELELAALFHDTGYARSYKGHEEKSVVIATAFLRGHGGSTRLIAQVRALILSTRVTERPRSLAQRVLRDADSAKAGQADFEEKSQRLRTEFEHQRRKKISALAWNRENLAYLHAHRFFTPYALSRFSKQKTLNLRALELRSKLPEKQAVVPPSIAHRFFDRDLSWLAFNARVLQEAQDDRVPLLERLKFLAIHSSNLDEFYRVRVAQLRSLRKLKKDDRSTLDVPPEKRIERINAEALEQQRRFGRLYRERLLPALEKHGVRFLSEDRLTAEQRIHVERFFTERVSPLLQTASLRTGNAPFIEDRKLYLVFDLAHKDSKKHKRVLVNVPSDELGRFITLPSKGDRTDLLFLDDAIRYCATKFFTGFKVTACHSIKLSRDAELYLDEEFAENVVDKVRRSLRKRRTGVPSRFLYDGAMPLDMLRQLRGLLSVKKQDLLRGGRYHNFSDMMALPVKGHADLREPPLVPVRHAAFANSSDPFAVIRMKDRLLHFPYHDFRDITELLRKAARDPKVKTIAITLYRVARSSLVCETLLEAARAGKKVSVFIEVQARFDEGNNLFWGEALEQAGAIVSYGQEGQKVHCKLFLIERREGSRTVKYAYLGTGNFNERTAAIYGDMAMLTTNAAITNDVAGVFHHLRDPRSAPRAKHLMVAPTTLRSGLEKLIDGEIANALSGKPASILLKLNSLEDRSLISKLYDASRAGVRIRLIIRGICCLMPGVPGLSEHIEVISIVDRFLEHARAYVFHNAGKPWVYLASADLMERNMDRRVEVAFPVLDPDLKTEVLEFVELQWRDTAKARTIDVTQCNAYRDPRWNKRNAVRSQLVMYTRLKPKARQVRKKTITKR